MNEFTAFARRIDEALFGVGCADPNDVYMCTNHLDVRLIRAVEYIAKAREREGGLSAAQRDAVASMGRAGQVWLRTFDDSVGYSIPQSGRYVLQVPRDAMETMCAEMCKEYPQ